MRYLPLAAVLLVLNLATTLAEPPNAPSARQQDAGAEAEIAALEDELNRAIVQGDVDFFERVLADDFTHMSQSGRFRTKAEWMKGRKAGQSPYKSFGVDNLSIRVYGATAVVTGVSKPEGKDATGAAIDGRFRFLRVWIKHDGRWQVVAFQGTRIDEKEGG